MPLERASTVPRLFQSTLPVRGATRLLGRFVVFEQISIHAPREGSDLGELLDAAGSQLISIHAPREGSDVAYTDAGFSVYYISIHAPREGSDA